jgi:hypothetical protein
LGRESGNRKWTGKRSEKAEGIGNSTESGKGKEEGNGRRSGTGMRK